MPDDPARTGVTHRDDDLQVTGVDDGGEPTAAMPPVGHGSMPASPPADLVATAPPHPSADDDDVAFWLLPAPPRPIVARAQPRPSTEPSPHPSTRPSTQPSTRAGRRAVAASPVPAQAPDDRPLADRLFASARPDVTRAVDRGGPAPVPARSPRAGSSAPTAGRLLDRFTAAVAPVLDRVGHRVVDRTRAVPAAWLVAAAAAAVAVVVVLGSLAVLGGGDEPAARTPSPAPSTTPTRVDAALVTASASSTQDPAGRTTYDAANTLDGKPTTAWNSHGAQDGPGPGITLTYSFEQPVDLRAISVTNGYQKTVTSKGKKVDLFAANARLKRVEVVTDTGRWTWDLKDAKAPQPLRRDFGTTSTVTIEIVSVYKGSRYEDVAVSDVAFTGVVQKS
jgi:hypothetical protein